MKKIGLAALLLMAALPAVNVQAGEKQSSPVLVSAKNSPVISLNLSGYLAQYPQAERVKIWVYFTDKEVFDEPGYSKAVQKRRTEFPQRALARKLKVKPAP